MDDKRLLVDVYPHLKSLPPKPSCSNGCTGFVNGIDLHTGPPYEYQCWGCGQHIWQEADGSLVSAFFDEDEDHPASHAADAARRDG